MNMSYCRFQNTLNDLRDCIQVLQMIEEFGGLAEVRSLLCSADDCAEGLEGDDLDAHRQIVRDLEDINLSDRELAAARELLHEISDIDAASVLADLDD